MHTKTTSVHVTLICAETVLARPSRSNIQDLTLPHHSKHFRRLARASLTHMCCIKIFRCGISSSLCHVLHRCLSALAPDDFAPDCEPSIVPDIFPVERPIVTPHAVPPPDRPLDEVPARADRPARARARTRVRRRAPCGVAARPSRAARQTSSTAHRAVRVTLRATSRAPARRASARAFRRRWRRWRATPHGATECARGLNPNCA
jgi:hypothetical protein